MTQQRADADAGEMAKKTLSAVIPVYFNAESLPSLLAEIGAVEKELLSRSVRLELIFVNDGRRIPGPRDCLPGSIISS
jgi:hypothetical protein